MKSFVNCNILRLNGACYCLKLNNILSEMVNLTTFDWGDYMESTVFISEI